MRARWSLIGGVLLLVLAALGAQAADFALLGYSGSPLSISADGSVVLLRAGDDYLLEDGVLTPVSSLPGFPADARAVDMSADGQVIVGNAATPARPSRYDEGFLWSGGVTTYLALDGTPGPTVSAVSGDGTTVVGRDAGVPYSWSAGTFTTLESLVDAGYPGSLFSADVLDVSHDGSVAVGYNKLTTNPCYQCDWAVRWNDGAATRLDDLLVPPAPDPEVSELMRALAVSDDGSVVTGSVRASYLEPQHFRLDSSGVGFLDDTDVQDVYAVQDISGDGSRIVGRKTVSSEVRGAGLWDPVNGNRFVADVLLEEYGITVPAGYEPFVTSLISADGRTLVGRATRPGGGTEIWLATLDEASVVPALRPSAALGLAIAVGLVGARMAARRGAGSRRRG